MKLLEKLRWLATERPCPGTAEVSAKSCVLAVLVGDTPGTRSARSRKLRPFIGRPTTSAEEIVPAIWLRAVSMAPVSPVTVILSSRPPTSRAIGSWKAAPTLRARGRLNGLEALRPHLHVVRADLEEGEAEPAVLLRDHRRP